MRIEKVMISFSVQEKIFKKHNIKREEVEAVFFDDPYVYRDKKGRYVAIGSNYVTVVFSFNSDYASVVTAYRSSGWQKRLYKVKK
jgi:uncharacterized DUF497 family protein